MAQDDKPDENLPPEQQLQKVLEARWDPSKLSRFMRASEGSRGRALDYSQRSRFEGRLGVDLSNVRIFSGELAEEITRAHGAEALTVGDTGIILMRNSTGFAPGTARGTALLAHELTHVAQNKPSAVSFKKPDANPLAVEESEAEAEAFEAEIHGEESGHGGKKDEAEKAQSQRERRQEIVEKVRELMMEELMMMQLRGGRSFDP